MPIPDGLKVALLREAAGLATQRDLASCCEFSKSTVANAEQSLSTTVNTLRAIARVIAVDWLDLLDPRAAENEPFVAGRTYTLQGVRRELVGWERGQDPGVPLRIDNLAIDLSEGWRLLLDAVHATTSRDVSLRLLMLAGPREALLDGDAPAAAGCCSRTTRPGSRSSTSGPCAASAGRARRRPPGTSRRRGSGSSRSSACPTIPASS